MLMIKEITINNLRSFKGKYNNIPFKQFNLLYAGNGAGKSTVLEAIQLCLTRDSSRTNRRNTEDIVSEIRTDGQSSGLLIELIYDENKSFKFTDRGSSSSFADLLGLYKREAHPKTAQSLLDTLFTTHNLLSQETIIKLLDDNNIKAFSRAVEEMIAGRNLMERWEKIQVLVEILEKEIQMVSEKIEEQKKNFEDIERYIKEQDITTVTKNILEDFKKMNSLINTTKIKPIIELEDKSLSGLSKWIGASRIIVNEIRNKLLQIEQLRLEDSEIIVASEINKSLSDIKERLGVFENSKVEICRKIEEISLRNKTLDKTMTDIAKNKNDLENAVEKNSKTLRNLKILDEWRLELLADLNTRQQKKELLKIQSKIEMLKKLISNIAELPSVDMFEATRTTWNNKRKEIDNSSVLIKNDSLVLEEEKARLGTLEKDYENRKKLQSERTALYMKLLEIVWPLLDKKTSAACPTCGTNFKNKTTLAQVIHENINSEIREKELSSEIENISKRRKRVAEINNRIQENYRKVSEEKNNISICDTKIHEWISKASIVRNIIQEIKVAKLEQPMSENFCQFLLDVRALELEKQMQVFQKECDALSSHITTSWFGLRGNDYKANKDNIFNICTEEGIISNIENELRDEERWRAKIAEKEEISKEYLEKRQQELEQLKTLSTEFEQNKSVLKNINNDFKNSEGKIEKSITHMKKISFLHKEVLKVQAYFEGYKDSININEMKTVLEKIFAEMNSLEQSISIINKVQLDNKEYNNRLKKIKDLIGVENEKLTFLRQIKESVDSITSLENRIEGEWQKYDDNINEFFAKLHAPPDYREVKLSKELDGLKFQVMSCITGEPKEATVLSSGQRAALAISIFCTLNLYGKDIPPIMLMDEPIQQVDDLNSLNFLDILRWVVENSKRQVFISTANSKVAGLIRRKFSYLSEQYNEVYINRTSNIQPIIRCSDGYGNIIYESSNQKNYLPPAVK